MASATTAGRVRAKPPALRVNDTDQRRGRATSANSKKRNAQSAQQPPERDVFDEVYCFCQQQSDSDMIQCDTCQDWYHTDCVGIASVDEVRSDDEYVCPQCRSSSANELEMSSSGAEESLPPPDPPFSASSLPKKFKAQFGDETRSVGSPDLHRGSPRSVTDNFRNLALSPTPMTSSRPNRSPSISESRQAAAAAAALSTLSSPPTTVNPHSAGPSSLSSSPGGSRRSSRAKSGSFSSSSSRSVAMKKGASGSRITGKAKGFDIPASSLADAQLSSSAPSSHAVLRQPPVTTPSRSGSFSSSTDASPASSSRGTSSKRLEHNERERQRRSTIRTLFEQLRRSVPAIEEQEGTSDRQILVEAAKHVEQLQDESRSIEEQLIRLKMENVRLKMEAASEQDREGLQAKLLALLGEAAEIAQMKDELESGPTPPPPVDENLSSQEMAVSPPGSPASHHIATPVSNAHAHATSPLSRSQGTPSSEAVLGSSPGGSELMQLLLIAEQEREELASNSSVAA